MFPDLALIVACYVNTRFFQIFFKGENGEEHPFIKFVAAISIVITIVCVIDIFMTGSRASSALSAP